MGRKKDKTKDPVTTLPASVSPEFEEMIVQLAKNMERTKSWLSAKLVLRGYLAILEGEGLLSESAVNEIIADKVKYKHVVRHAKQLLMGGITPPSNDLPDDPLADLDPDGEELEFIAHVGEDGQQAEEFEPSKLNKD